MKKENLSYSYLNHIKKTIQIFFWSEICKTDQKTLFFLIKLKLREPSYFSGLLAL